MDWNRLTDRQQSTYLDFEHRLRNAYTQVYAAMKEFATLDAEYDLQILPIVTLLTDGTAVPNQSGWHGSDSLTDTELATLVAHMRELLARDTDKSLRDRAAGMDGER